jgi:GT2 family glycosyltransferase
VVAGAIKALHDGAAGGGSAFRFDGNLPTYAWMMQHLARPVYRRLGLASGCFLFCTRTAFDALGGFDESLYAAEEAAMSRALARYGRFVVLRQSVVTSGRKIRAHSAREILSLLVRFALRGRKALRQREGLEIWYGDRRRDPDAPTQGHSR